MGLEIRLYIRPDSTVFHRWDRAYRETVTLLHHFTGAAGLPDVKPQARGTFEEGLEPAGFRLYRRAERQFFQNFRDGVELQNERSTPEEDVVWTAGRSDATDVVTVATRPDGVVRGTEYYPALAAALLLERYFPDYAFVHGHIWSGAVRAVQEYIPVDLPICMDGPTLLARLRRSARTGQNATTTARRFSRLFIGGRTDCYRALTGYFDRFDPLVVNQIFLEEMAGFDSLRQLGAGDLAAVFLAASGDPGRLFSLVDLVDIGRPGAFTRPVLLDALSVRGLTIGGKRRLSRCVEKTAASSCRPGSNVLAEYIRNCR